MSAIQRCVSFAILCLAALGVSAQGQAFLNGTWRFDMSKTKFSDKPFVIYTSQGWFHCVSCTTPYDVQADGQDHPTADKSFDTYAVSLADDHTIQIVGKKDGKVVLQITGKLSADGKSMTTTSVADYGSGSQSTFVETSKRVGTLPAGVHPTSGNWVATKSSGNDVGTTLTYKVDGDQVSMTDPTGESYTAKLDGVEVPVKGSVGWDAVSLKKIDDHTIEETDKSAGKVTAIAKWTPAGNGKMLSQVVTEQPSGRVTTYYATKK